jgi:hypothetical protein
MDNGQQIARHDLDAMDFAAVWPTSASIVSFPVPDLELISPRQDFRATPAAPEVPAAVGGLLAASYAGLIVALAVATADSSESIFTIAIAALFVVIFFSVPRIFFAVEPDSSPRTSFDAFLHEGMDTFTGHNSGRAALVQMLIVPLLLTLAILAMGIIIATAA